MSTPPPPPGSEPIPAPDASPLPPPVQVPSSPGSAPYPPASAGPPGPYAPGGYQPGAFQPPPGQPPPRYEAYGAYGSPVPGPVAFERTRGLRIATIVLMWVATAAAGIQLLTIVNRRTVWNDPTSSIDDLLAADDAVGGALFFYTLAAIATAIVLSIWSLRSVGNAEKLGVAGVRPGLACGGWYIPFGNVFVPYIQLRRAGKALGVNGMGLAIWQVGLGVLVFSGFMVNLVVGNGDPFDPDEIETDLDAQVAGSTVTFVFAVAAVIGATIATRALDRTIAARSGA